MTEWQCSSANELIFEEGDVKVRLYTVGERGSPAEIPSELCKEYGLYKYVLEEWTEYFVRAEGAKRLTFGGLEADCITIEDGLYRYKYRNQIGKSTIVITVANTTLRSLNVEVLSSKLTLDEAREPDNPEAGRQALPDELQNTEKRAGLREDLRKCIEGGTTEESSAATAFAYPRMALKALRMLHDLYTTGFASFA
jgi:hypothetical protein